MNNLDTSLEKNFSTTISFMNGLETLSTKIGNWGGRSFTLKNAQGQKISYKMKDLVQHLDYLITKDKTTSQPSIQILLAKSVLVACDMDAEIKLSKMTFKVRFLTLLRRILNIFKKSHFNSLNRIVDKHTDSPKIRQLYTELKKIMPNKNIMTQVDNVSREVMFEKKDPSNIEKFRAEFQNLESFYKNSCNSDRYIFSRVLILYQKDYGFTSAVSSITAGMLLQELKPTKEANSKFSSEEENEANNALTQEIQAYVLDINTRDKAIVKKLANH